MSTSPSPNAATAATLARWALAIVLIGTSLRLLAEVQGVDSVAITVGDLERATQFYTTVLPFKVVTEEIDAPRDDAAHFALPHALTESRLLQLGEEKLRLTEFKEPRGAPYPSDSRSFDHWFQHIAIVVRDMDAAYAQLAAAGVRHISTAPQTLPLSNPNAGGIRAFYFQDPEGHVLEIIWFPPGKGDVRWQTPTDQLFLGIDHTAIVVSDTEKSLAYYRDALGFVVAGGAENFGTEQEHLNQVFGARLRITALRAPKGPAVEFLEYITPPGGRALPACARPNDSLAWRIHLIGSPSPAQLGVARRAGGIAVSPTLLRDPDGHLLDLGAPAP